MADLLPAPPADATLVEADQWEADALASIEAVDTPEAAEALLKAVKTAERAFAIHRLGADRERRWKLLTLKAERRYGELLPPKQKPGWKPKAIGNSALPKDDLMAQSRARKVAEVPEEKFEEYVEQERQPTRAGLLRLLPQKKAKAKPKPPEPQLVDYLPDMLPGAEPEGAFRQEVVGWCDAGRRIDNAMGGTGMTLVPKSDEDRGALLAALVDMRKLAARLEKQLGETDDQSS